MRWVFGYGSLMYEPELPEAVVVRRVGRVAGLRRRFNKRSISRGCRQADALCPTPVEGWHRGDLRLSLVLGTEPEPRGTLVGLALGYPDDVSDTLLARLQAREGPGYRHAVVQVATDDGPVQAWTWLTDPDSELLVDLSLDAAARILHAATPRVPGPRALGAEYLLGVEAYLAQLGHPDPDISALCDRVRALQDG